MKISKFKKAVIALIMAVSIMVSQAVVMADTEETVPEPQGNQTSETVDLSGYSFETLYGSQLMSFLNHQYYFDGQEIPIAESNFYFINAFLEFNNIAAYGYYPITAEGFVDLSASNPDENYDTMGDFLIAYAEQTIEIAYVTNSRANEMGLTLSEETEGAIDQMIANLDEQGAQLSNMSLDDYIKLYYGDTCDEAAFREILHHYYLRDVYINHYCDTYEFTEEQKNVPNVRYALFYAPQDSDEADLTNAETLANEMLSAATDLDTLQTLCEQAAEDGIVLDQGDYIVQKGDTVPDFENWAYGTHNVGDIEVIYSPEYGYFVVGYLGKTELPQEELDEIAVSALTDEVKSEISGGTFDFHTNDAYSKAQPVEGEITEAPSSTGETQVSARVVEKNNKTNVFNVVLIVLAVIGGVAIVAVIVIMVVYFIRNGSSKKETTSSEEEKESSEE